MASEYEGGGIVVLEEGEEEEEGCVVKVNEGEAFIFRGGEMSHGGRNVRSGVRYIIALFIFSHRDPDVDEDDEEGGQEEV